MKTLQRFNYCSVSQHFTFEWLVCEMASTELIEQLSGICTISGMTTGLSVLPLCMTTYSVRPLAEQH